MNGIENRDERTLLRKAFGAFATGVTVVTVGGSTPHGMTANSFTSVSLDPPLVLVCVDHKAVMHRLLGVGSRFGVSVLRADQEPAARHFADRHRPVGMTEFDSQDWHPGPVTEVPLIKGALASFECEVSRCHEGGDHTIFLARVLGVEGPASADGGAAEDPPLTFYRGRLGRLCPEPPEQGIP